MSFLRGADLIMNFATETAAQRRERRIARVESGRNRRRPEIVEQGKILAAWRESRGLYPDAPAYPEGWTLE